MNFTDSVAVKVKTRLCARRPRRRNITKHESEWHVISLTLSLRQHRSPISTVAEQDWKGSGMIRSRRRVTVYPDLKRQKSLKNTGPKYMSMFMCTLPAEWILCSVNRQLTSSAQKEWTRWQGCFLAYPTVCLSSKYGNEAFGYNPTLPTCTSHNPLLVHRLHLGYDVTGLQQGDGKSTISYRNINRLLGHFRWN